MARNLFLHLSEGNSTLRFNSIKMTVLKPKNWKGNYICRRKVTLYVQNVPRTTFILHCKLKFPFTLLLKIMS